MLEIDEHKVVTKDKNVYRIEGMNPSTTGSGFKIHLNYYFAKLLMETEAVERRENVAEFLETISDGLMNSVMFKEDSFLLQGATIATQATGIDLTRMDEIRGCVYHTHNVDTPEEAYEIISLFTKWVDYGHAVIKSDYPQGFVGKEDDEDVYELR